MSIPAKDGSTEKVVGLSNSSLSQSRRKMLDLVNKLYNIGFVCHVEFCKKMMNAFVEFKSTCPFLKLLRLGRKAPESLLSLRACLA